MYKIQYKIENLIDNIKYFFKRGKNGYADIDTYNFDEYVARLIKENCFILAEEFHGYPEDISDKEWKQILLDISFGFGSYLEMRSGVYEIKDAEFKRLKKEYENGLKLFTKYHQYIWD